MIKKIKNWIRSHQKGIAFGGLLLGLLVVASFPLSEIYDSWRRDQVVKSIDEEQISHPDEQTKELLEQANAYNLALAGIYDASPISPEDIWPYEKQMIYEDEDLPFSYLIIPAIGLRMPIYHGTDQEVLSAGAGHVKGTSLPVGAQNTHTAVSAHSGMAAMRAFDDIRKLEKGDLFGFRSLGDNYVYEVDSIETVLPEEVEKLSIVPDQDRATLITCTPYGINDHRLLVSGHRIETPADWEKTEMKTADPVASVSSYRFVPFIAALIFVVAVLIFGYVRSRKGAKKKGVHPDNGI